MAMILFLNSDGEIAELWQSLKVNLGLSDVVASARRKTPKSKKTKKEKPSKAKDKAHGYFASYNRPFLLWREAGHVQTESIRDDLHV